MPLPRMHVMGSARPLLNGAHAPPPPMPVFVRNVGASSLSGPPPAPEHQEWGGWGKEEELVICH